MRSIRDISNSIIEEFQVFTVTEDFVFFKKLLFQRSLYEKSVEYEFTYISPESRRKILRDVNHFSVLYCIVFIENVRPACQEPGLGFTIWSLSIAFTQLIHTDS